MEVPVTLESLPEDGIVWLLRDGPLPSRMERRQIVADDGNNTVLRVRVIWDTVRMEKCISKYEGMIDYEGTSMRG